MFRIQYTIQDNAFNQADRQEFRLVLAILQAYRYRQPAGVAGLHRANLRPDFPLQIVDVYFIYFIKSGGQELFPLPSGIHEPDWGKKNFS